MEGRPGTMSSKKQIRVRGKPVGQAAAAMDPASGPFQTVVRKSPHELTFTLSPTHVSYANTLRRAMLTLVESVGFRADIDENGSTTDVKILKNSTPMSNEMLAHRIGLLPIHIENPLTFDSAEYSFRIAVKNEDATPRDICASDIQVQRKGKDEEEATTLPSKEFFHPDPLTHDTALLLVLKGKHGTQAGEELVCEMKASVGTGRENARFIPVSQCSYGYTLDTNPERMKKTFQDWLSSHKKVALSELEANAERKGELEREFKTMEIARCFLQNEKGEPISFDFTVESKGVLSCDYVVARALDILQAKLLKYGGLDSGDLPETVEIHPADARMRGYDFLFKGEDHTLGNLLQTYMEQNMMADGELTFVGYKVPHPLRDEMVLRLGIKSEDRTQVPARQMVAKAARDCAQMFRTWRSSWELQKK
jgi:DNA-directed RNA polymerase subunit L/DNA-directed RNA polymerase alpha subunit